MYLSGVNYESIADGVGVRTTIFISGCLHECNGCHSPDTHSFTNGVLCDDKIIDLINKEMSKRTYLSGITLSGGDCMFSPLETLKLLKQLQIPHNNIWCFSGFRYEDIINNPYRLQLLKKIDVLVDGKFELSLRDTTLKFRGSSNQRIIDVKKSLAENKIILYDE